MVGFSRSSVLTFQGDDSDQDNTIRERAPVASLSVPDRSFNVKPCSREPSRLTKRPWSLSCVKRNVRLMWSVRISTWSSNGQKCLKISIMVMTSFSMTKYRS